MPVERVEAEEESQSSSLKKDVGVMATQEG